MPHHDDLDPDLAIYDPVDDPIVADPYPPKVLSTLKFLTAWGLGFFDSPSILARMRWSSGLGRASSSLRADRAKLIE